MGGCCGCLQVNEGTVTFVEWCGKFEYVATPGCYCLKPCQTVRGSLSTRIEQLDVTVHASSKENISVTITVTVRHKLLESQSDLPRHHAAAAGNGKRASSGSDAGAVEMTELLDDRVETLRKAMYGLANFKAQITTTTEAFFRSECIKINLLDIQSARDDLIHKLCVRLNEELNPYGHVITQVLIDKVEGDPRLIKSLNDITIAQNNRLSAQANAEAQTNAAITKAKGDAQVHELAGEGIARCRKAIISGLKSSVEDFRKALPGTDPNTVMSGIMMQQYMEVLKEAASHGGNTFILPSSPTHATDLEGQMRMALLAVPPPKLSMTAAAAAAPLQ